MSKKCQTIPKNKNATANSWLAALKTGNWGKQVGHS